MGVHGLWDLLSPVGRRVSVETLAGKRLAIDASIWMVQFMKAMRDERGEMVRNAHILGFFRRICKLLFLRTKPVFVFDGATPALKRRTVIARRRQRENAQTKIRKTAEKLLLNHLKAMRLQELADDLENQRKSNVDKGKRVITDEDEIVGTSAKINSSGTKGFDQEALDAMLAASLEAEEAEGFTGDASTSGTGVVEEDEDEDDDDDEEMLIPALQGKVDPAVLASLPPSMQLDLLGQMRERLMAENRQKYQKVKKAPAKFSELQIESYLKTVAFRREINEVQKVAGGRGVDGVQTSRIASESNREFIFSSSFTGNKRSFTSAGVETNSHVQNQMATRHSSTGSVSDAPTNNKSSSAFESLINKPKKMFNEDVETYRDDRGRVRINKMKAMGIRMTRDLQRNLDLMKEIEQHKTEHQSKLLESSKETNQESIPVSGTTIEVSFEDDNEQQFVDSDDDVFARIVADDTSSEKQPTIDFSDVEWEEGIPGGNNGERPLDESEVEWEDGPSDIPEIGSAREVEHVETVSKGELLEEADIQEAIRRSMGDMKCQKDIDASFSPEDFKDDKNMDIEASLRLYSASGLPNNSSDDVDETKINTTNNSSTTQLEVTNLNDPNSMEMQLETLYQNDKKDDDELSIKDTSDDQNSQGETGHMDMVNSTEENEVDLSNELHGDNCRENAETLISSNNLSPDVVADVTHADAQQLVVKDLVIDHIPETLEPKGTAVKESKSEFDIVQNVTEEDSNAFTEKKEDDVSKFVLADMSEEQVEITKANLEEEMTNLSKERADLGDEQRRLECNSASVSGEMFTECQELLHMFGLPYIIAPMEAEAQCAYMELENLVDGVVTDDSDVLLFGARSVYKNIFDDRKYVETYFMKDVESELGLTREKLIRMAMLLGSDYTEGVSGIGIVNAVEVLNAFPEENGLHKFREWIESPDPTIFGKIDAKKRKSINIAEEATVDQGVSGSDDDINRMKQIFMDKHRNVSKNWHIPSTFPSDTVISAYASPQVDRSTEPFSWGKPDLFVLRKLCFEKFGWGTQKADELLQPVLKEYNKHETQLRLEAFYTFNERFAKIRSKRISKAVKGIAGSNSSDLMDNNEVDSSNGKKRKKVKQEKCKDDVEKEQITILKNTKKGSSVRGRGRGRGRGTGTGTSTGTGTGTGTGRGRGKSVGRGKRKTNNNLEVSGTSSDDGDNSDFVQEVNAEHTEAQHGVRKSKRVKKSVISMNIDDWESDEPTSQKDHAEVAGNEEPTSNDHKSPLPGSGIHSDEAEVDKDWCQNDEIGRVADLSKDYLKMGGGFCFEDDEGEKELEISEPTKGLKEAEASINPNVATDLLQKNNEEEDDDGMRPIAYLSAMPNLKRKRKKV